MPTSKKATSPKIAKKPKVSSAHKVFDVARPGKSAPSSTSRPVIITNRPIVQDPMVTASALDAPTTAPVLQAVKKVRLTPLHDHVVPEETAVPTVPNTPPPLADLQPTTLLINEAAPSGPTQPPQVADNMLTPPATSPNQPSSTSIAIPAAVSHDDDSAALQATQNRQAQLQRLIEKEQYFLPINTKEDRRNKRLAIAGMLLVIILAAAWYDTALDANLLSNHYNLPHTHFFSST